MSQTETPEDTDRFDAEIYDLDLYDDEAVPGPDSECTPTEHAGVKTVVYAIGPNGQDVRKATMCSECGMAMQEMAYTDAHGILVEGMGRTLDRVLNLPGEEPEYRARIPIPEGELDECDDPVVTTLQLSPKEQEIIIGYVEGDESESPEGS